MHVYGHVMYKVYYVTRDFLYNITKLCFYDFKCTMYCVYSVCAFNYSITFYGTLLFRCQAWIVGVQSTFYAI